MNFQIGIWTSDICMDSIKTTVMKWAKVLASCCKMNNAFPLALSKMGMLC